MSVVPVVMGILFTLFVVVVVVVVVCVVFLVAIVVVGTTTLCCVFSFVSQDRQGTIMRPFLSYPACVAAGCRRAVSSAAASSSSHSCSWISCV